MQMKRESSCSLAAGWPPDQPLSWPGGEWPPAALPSSLSFTHSSRLVFLRNASGLWPWWSPLPRRSLPPYSYVALPPQFPCTFPGEFSDHSIQSSNPSYSSLARLFTLFYFCPEGVSPPDILHTDLFIGWLPVSSSWSISREYMFHVNEWILSPVHRWDTGFK